LYVLQLGAKNRWDPRTVCDPNPTGADLIAASRTCCGVQLDRKDQDVDAMWKILIDRGVRREPR